MHDITSRSEQPEEIVGDRSGRYHSPEEVVTRAQETLAEKEPPHTQRKKTPAEAVADIRELRKGVTLGGLKIRDLSDEGRLGSNPASFR